MKGIYENKIDNSLVSKTEELLKELEFLKNKMGKTQTEIEHVSLKIDQEAVHRSRHILFLV